MKTSILVIVLTCLPTVLFSQRQIMSHHYEIEALFANKSLQDLESELDLTSSQEGSQLIRDHVDERYQQFFESVRYQLSSSFNVDQKDVDKAYGILITELKEEIFFMKGGSTPNNWGAKQQDGPCVNMDFEEGDFNGWTLTRGNVTGATPYSFDGEFAVGPGTYHTVYGGGVDPVTGIPRVNPDGGGFSARLGNGTGVGARGARLKQTFMVDATNYMFTYSYAVVFESPAAHTLNQQPYFTVRVFDSLGNSIPCGEYSVIADAASATDYDSTIYGGTTVYYKNWETVFTNLLPYIGQNVTIEFTSGDCSLTGHYGYAYVDASCGIAEITATNDLICSGDSSVLTAPPGLEAYQWSNGDTTQSTTVTSGGQYSCTLLPVQGQGCSITLGITIDENPSPTATFTPNTISICLNDSITFTNLSSIPAPGTINGYQWDFGDGTSTPMSTGPISGVPNTSGDYLLPTHIYTSAGTFDVQLIVESTDGCTDTASQIVTVNALPVVVGGPNQYVCDGDTVMLSSTGADTYVWDNGVTEGVPFVQNIGTIVYTLIGTDAMGCQSSDTAIITVNPLPVLDVGIDSIVVCQLSEVTLTATGAVVHNWNNGITNGVPFVPSVGTTVYTVLGMDANGCINSDSVTIITNELPVITAGPNQLVCENDSVTLTASGADTYEWDNPAVTNGVPFLQPVGIETYVVTGTNSYNCVSTDTINLTVSPLPIVDAGPDKTVCEGTSVVLSGSGASSYSWNNGIKNNIAFVQSVGTITYTVIGTNFFGCTNSDNVNVTVNPNPIVYAGPDTTICEGTQITLSANGTQNLEWNNGIMNNVPFIQPVGVVTYVVYDTLPTGCGTSDSVTIEVLPLPVITVEDAEICLNESVTLTAQGALTYEWSDGIENGVPFYPTETSVYTVTGINTDGCMAQAHATVFVRPLPIADFEILNPELSTVNSVTNFDNTSYNAVSFHWDFGDGTSSNEWEPQHEFPFDEGDTYVVTLTAYTAYGCPDQISKVVEVEQDHLIFVPNTFTPNGDGFNETFKPVMDGFEEDTYTVYIFNRWGDLVFQSHDMNVGWDGTFARHDFQAQDGVYTWKIVAGLKESDERRIYVGHVTILR